MTRAVCGDVVPVRLSIKEMSGRHGTFFEMLLRGLKVGLPAPTRATLEVEARIRRQYESFTVPLLAEARASKEVREEESDRDFQGQAQMCTSPCRSQPSATVADASLRLAHSST